MNTRLQTTMMSHLTSQPFEFARETIAISEAASAAVAARRSGRGQAQHQHPHTDGAEAFRFAQDILVWINGKMVELEGTGYGKDLDSCRDALEYHQSVHEEIMQYKRQVDRCREFKVLIPM